jgi:hypothetical protein
MTVEFDESSTIAKQLAPQAQPPFEQHTGIVGFMVRKGITKSTQRANVVLATIALILLGASAVLLFSLFTFSRPQPPTPEEKQIIDKMQQGIRTQP